MLVDPTAPQSVVPWFVQTVQANWVVIIGIFALFLYGRFHFNTPEYSLLLSNEGDAAHAVGLLTPTPPIFTARRSRYNNFMLRYVAILELSFLVIVFVPTLVANVSVILKFGLPDLSSDSMQLRVVIALFALTGVLPSFPGFRAIDQWLLQKLHQAAFIPGDAYTLAERLSAATFLPSKGSIGDARSNLTARDTTRIADKLSTGRLEQRVFNLLCLRSQLQFDLNLQRFIGLRVRLRKDLESITRQTDGLQVDLRVYFKRQERLIPSEVRNIDAYISDNSDNEEIADLAKSRVFLQSRCDQLYDLICLVVALALFATEYTTEDIDQAILHMGFDTRVDPVPVVDWETIGIIVVSTCLVTLAGNALYVGTLYFLGLTGNTDLMPSKSLIIRFVAIFTIIYGIVMWIALSLKRHWRLQGSRTDKNPENFMIAISAYVCTVPLNLAINATLHHGLNWSYAPFLYALNQATFGYFIGKYIDRSLKKARPSIMLSLSQGGAQGIAITVATLLSPATHTLTIEATVLLTCVPFLQVALSGFIAGLLFQRSYRRDNIIGSLRSDQTLVSIDQKPGEEAKMQPLAN